MAGISREILIDPRAVQKKLDGLAKQQNDFIERQIKSFLQSYGTRRNMSPGIERTKYVLSKLTDRPVYYVKFVPRRA